MREYTHFSVVEDATSPFPVIQGYAAAVPGLGLASGTRLAQVRDDLRGLLERRVAAPGPGEDPSVAVQALARFDALYGSARAPGVSLRALAPKLVSLLKTYRKRGQAALYVTDELTLELEWRGSRGQIHVEAGAHNGLRLAFLPVDIRILESLLEAAGFEGPFVTWADTANSVTVRVPPEQLPPVDVAQKWLHSRTI